MEYKDYYKILGVSKQADDKEIKRAYRKLAQKYHPDKNPGNKSAEERFKAINEANEVLGNPENRAKYDQLGHNYHRYQQMGGNPADYDFSQWFSGGQGQGQRVNVDFGDMFGGSSGGMSDFFNVIFGGGMGQQRSAGMNDYFGRQSVNPDIEQTVEISLEEAYNGATRTFSQNGEQFTAKIPAGAKTGSKIRLRGKGNPGGRQGRGDLYLVVKVLPHAIFKRMGNNLQVTVKVDVVTAVLGGKVEVPTLTGPVHLTIPAGTQGGQTHRLKGKGMPQLHNNDLKGDLLAEINIRVPKKLSPAERTLYEQLAQLKESQPVQ